MKTALGIKIGADPEFAFKQNGGFIPASQVFGNSDTSTPLGTDGRSDTAELRPSPGSYYQVNSSISKLLTDAKRLGYQAFAGSGDYAPLGGHIHFSGISPDRDLVKKLDQFIAKPLNTISDCQGRRRHYGHYGEVRSQPHGWEYRAPLSWLSTPILTKGSLAIAWVLARAFKMHDLDTITTQAHLLNYAYKGERIAISLFFDAIKNYKRSDIKLEQVEIFQAWGKTIKPQPTLIPQFSEDEFMQGITQFIRDTTSQHKSINRYNPYQCYHRLLFYGVRASRTQEKAIFTNMSFNGQHIGASVIYDRDTYDYRIGLSYNLRKDTKRCAWVIKRIVKSINVEHERSLQCVA